MEKSKWEIVNKNKMESSSSSYREVPEITIFLEKFKLNSKSKIADFGCYTGQDIIKLSRKFPGNFFGYDLVQNSIQSANKLMISAELEPRVKFQEIDLETDMHIFADKSFNFSIIKNVLPFIKNKEKILLELNRITSQGIILVISLTPDLKNPSLTKRGVEIAMEYKELNDLLNPIFGKKFNMIKNHIDKKDPLLTSYTITIEI